MLAIARFLNLTVTPAEAGVQVRRWLERHLDSGLRRNDGLVDYTRTHFEGG